MQDTLVFSIALNGYSFLFNECLESQKRYAKKFGYKYSLVKKTPFPLTNEDAAWLKLYLLKEALSMDFKWVAFIDADCEIREHTPDFRQFMVDSSPKSQIFMAKGFSGRINSGVIFIKNGNSSLDFLNIVLDSRFKNVPDEDKALYENGHIIHFGKNNPKVKLIDNSIWNNNFESNHQSYIQHFSGGLLREKFLKTQPIRTSLYKWYKRLILTRRRVEQINWEKNKSIKLKQILLEGLKN